jgi:hypothetical protein
MITVLVCLALTLGLLLAAYLGYQLGYQQARLEDVDVLLRLQALDTPPARPPMPGPPHAGGVHGRDA